jgi:hypothetical protein
MKESRTRAALAALTLMAIVGPCGAGSIVHAAIRTASRGTRRSRAHLKASAASASELQPTQAERLFDVVQRPGACDAPSTGSVLLWQVLLLLDQPC